LARKKKATKEKWISEAIQQPGALRSQAKREGAMSKSGKIEEEWLNEKAKQGGTVGRRARLAKTLKKLGKKKSKK